MASSWFAKVADLLSLFVSVHSARKVQAQPMIGSPRPGPAEG